MNLDDCVDKLYEAILEAAQTPKEPDEEQRAKVKRM
jgi:formiminotetrahydrofolate cyclodeaminase